MFKGLFTRVLQHLIAQNNWARDILLPFAGQSIQVDVAMMHATLIILEDGSLAISGESHAPDAVIQVSPSVALRLMAQDNTAKREVNIAGDAHLASELAKVFTHMRWDYTDDLSRVIGEVPAHQVSQFAQKAVNSVQQTGQNMAEMLAEYWQEEKPMIAKKYGVEKFNADVDSLRADVARLEKKLKKLTAKLGQ